MSIYGKQDMLDALESGALRIAPNPEVHQTAPTVHADFRGAIRLEIANVGPFVCRLTPGIRICQLIIEELKTPATEGLLSRFQDQAN